MNIEPGRNCWRTSKAEKATLLIDGEAYYAEFRKAIIKAKSRIVIVGWDIDSRMDLLRSEEDDGYPHRLGDLFLQVLKKNRRLHIYILLWDFAMIYAFDRDWAPVLNHAEWRRHKRMHLILDGNHRKAASHHQKIVTIDQSLAFVGGFDLSKQRWDTTQHAVDDQRRVDGAGNAYEPFHDMQWMFSGKVVQDINILVNERWQNATSKSMAGKKLDQDSVHFSEHMQPVFEDIPLAIGRTWFTKNNEDIREVEQMHIDAIKSARKLIYIENQYLSSSAIGDALLDKLKQANGPEIVIVLPKECGGWLEKQTMDVLRARIISMLKKADTHKKLRIFYPKIDAQDKQVVSVHAKMFIIDDILLKVGSANLSNRSMALDSECDILMSADGRDDISDKIKAIRHRLLCEHMDADTDEFAKAEENSSMIQAIEKLNKKEHCLAILKHGVDEALIDDIDTLKIADPEHPVDPEHLINHFIGDTAKKDQSKNIKKFIFIILALVAVALIWILTPVGDWVDKEAIASLFETWNETNPLLGKIYFVSGFTILGVLGVPITVLIGSSGILFGTLPGTALALLGCLLSATGSFLIGHFAGKNFIRNFGGEKINSVSKRLSQRGILTIIAVRIVPVAPYTIINMLAGASKIRWRDFAIGTFVGMLPGTLLLTTFFSQLIELIKDVEFSNLPLLTIAFWVALAILLGVGVFYLIRKKKN